MRVSAGRFISGHKAIFRSGNSWLLGGRTASVWEYWLQERMLETTLMNDETEGLKLRKRG
jgi:hypothetical protein